MAAGWCQNNKDDREQQNNKTVRLLTVCVLVIKSPFVVTL